MNPELESSAPGLAKRQAYCESQLDQVSQQIAAVGALPPVDQLCIYVCGSYGRMEASQSSDLDVFLLANKAITKIDEILVKSELIKITRSMKFPEFSNDGQYLSTHSVDDILERLGSPEDDYYNHFTARMLLLLESRPVYGHDAYKSAIQEIVQAYFRDYHDHEKDFRPVFLMNDLVRFWKTFCLNYEHRRNRRDKTEAEKAKDHLKNLKLKYSRLLTCFSMILPLVSNPACSVSDVVELAMTTPLERLSGVVNDDTREIFKRIIAEYAWFLDTVQDDGMVERLQDRAYRDTVFSKAREFGGAVFSLLEARPAGSTLRYLVV